jgi:RNA polymerase sigma factor (sigma-70 family)
MQSSREQAWAQAMRAERRGDAIAYERLLREIAELLRSVVRSRLTRYGLGAHHAEDVVQEVLIGIHTKRHAWDASRPFMPWLLAIVHYKFVDTVRRLKRESSRRVEIDFEAWADLFEAPTADTERDMMDLTRQLSGLPRGQQAVVQALAIEGTSVRATAQRLKTSEGAVRVTFHRALARLMAKANVGHTVVLEGDI